MEEGIAGADNGVGGAAVELPLGCDPSTPGLALKDWVGVFSIRAAASQLCLHKGDVTTLMTTVTPADTAYSVGLNDTCQFNEWMLEADSLGYYEVISLEVENRVLDIETGRADEGTRAVLYSPRTSATAHQRFYFVERAAGTFGIVPRHATGKCVTDTPDGLQIWQCQAENSAQSWQLYSAACVPSSPEP